MQITNKFVTIKLIKYPSKMKVFVQEINVKIKRNG